MNIVTEPLPPYPRATKRTDIAVLNAWRLSLSNNNAPAYVVTVVGRSHDTNGYLRFYAWTLDAKLTTRPGELREWLPRLYRNPNRFTIETVRFEAVVQRATYPNPSAA